LEGSILGIRQADKCISSVYYQVKRKHLHASAMETALVLFISKLLSKNQRFEKEAAEALECESLVMATLLHPHPEFCLRFFYHFWPERDQHEQLLLEKNFNRWEAPLKQSPDDIEDLEKDSPKVDNNNIFELFNAPPNYSESRELEVYVKNMDRLATPAAKDQNSLLICGCGILKPQTIERCLSSHMWLKQGIQVTGKFLKAQKIFKNCVDFSQKNSKK
ncbi:hypothetical protein VP01_892g1, partial [Puccinia sorghi]